MRKKNLVFLSVLLLASLFGALTLAAAPAPDPALADVFSARSVLHPSGIRLASSGVYCDFSHQHTSPTMSASGSTCADAKNNLASNLTSYADNDCVADWTDYPACKVVVIYNNDACISGSASGAYSTMGHATYDCLNSGN